MVQRSMSKSKTKRPRRKHSAEHTPEIARPKRFRRTAPLDLAVELVQLERPTVLNPPPQPEE